MCDDLDEVLSRAKKKGVNYFLTISTEDKEYTNILKIVNKYDQVYGTYGIHPHEAKSHLNIKCEDILKKIKLSNKIIGIGESGLDFFYNHSDENDQKKLFLEHILASQKSNLPLIVHTRSAETETLDILKSELKNSTFKVLIHCFTGTKNFAKKLIDLGAYISASGVVTFKKSLELAETFKGIPNDKMLIETDSPYLAPEPLRGKSNEPGNIIHTLNFLSQIKQINKDELSIITSNNFFKLFGNLN
jgi:TatD DNase family protein